MNSRPLLLLSFHDVWFMPMAPQLGLLGRTFRRAEKARQDLPEDQSLVVSRKSQGKL